VFTTATTTTTTTTTVLAILFVFQRPVDFASVDMRKKVAHTRLPIERRVPELIPVLGSQSAGDVSHKLGGRLPLLSDRPAVTLATLKRAATNFATW